jgi:hypothetical protein
MALKKLLDLLLVGNHIVLNDYYTLETIMDYDTKQDVDSRYLDYIVEDIYATPFCNGTIVFSIREE